MIEQIKNAEDITEKLKAANQMELVRMLNSIPRRVETCIVHDLIYQQNKDHEKPCLIITRFSLYFLLNIALLFLRF